MYKTRSVKETCTIIYVDDILIASKDINEIKRVENKLSISFDVSRLRNVKDYSEVQVIRDKNGNFSMYQEKYINEILNTYGLTQTKISNIYLDVGYKNERESKTLPDNKQYQSLIGSLMYITISTHPDIVASVTILSRKLKNPTDSNWIEAKRVARYLKLTKKYKLKLGNNIEEAELIGYVDADWAEERVNRKSQLGLSKASMRFTVFNRSGICKPE